MPGTSSHFESRAPIAASAASCCPFGQACRPWIIALLVGVAFLACEEAPPDAPRIEESTEGYVLPAGLPLRLRLETPLSSKRSARGDRIVSRTLAALTHGEKTVVTQGSEVRGLVKRASGYESPEKPASLLLVFDQLVLPDGTPAIPIVASLDTSTGAAAVKIEGKAIRDAKIIGHAALAGALIGQKTLGPGGAEKGFAIGAGLGTSAVFLSGLREVSLPAGTTLDLRLTAPVVVPKLSRDVSRSHATPP